MPKARSLRESFSGDERIITLSPPANLLFRALIGEADDHGRVQAHPAVLHGRLFAASRRPLAPADVAEALAELEGDGILRRYQKRGRSYAVILGWEDPTCPWYQHLTQRAMPLHPGPDDPEEPHQMDLPLRAEGARRGKRERAAEGRGEHRPGPVGRDVDPADAGADPAARGGPGRGPGERDGGAAAADGGADLVGGGGGAEDRVDRAGERAGRDEAGPEEPANGAEARDFTGSPSRRTPRAELAIAPVGASGAAAGPTPAGPTSPPAAAGASSSATPTAAAGGLLAPQALALFAEAAGDRWAPGKPHATATGLPHAHEAAWQRVWSEARAAGYGAEDLRALGLAVREGRIWKGGALSPGKLVQHLLDLLAESAAPVHERGPPWQRENPFDRIAEELEERDVVTVECTVET